MSRDELLAISVSMFSVVIFIALITINTMCSR
jgi:hypothetical protein